MATIHGGASCWLAAVFLLLVLALQGAAEPLVPAMYVFGDSIVDVGNNNFIDKCDFTCKADHARYGVDFLDHAPTGRFSNGYNLADLLAQQLGFAESPPAFLSLTDPVSRMSTGINFASGGSGLFPSTGNAACTQVLSVAEQVGNFTNLVRQWASSDNRSAEVLSKSLFFISAGSNDLFEYTATADLGGPPKNDTELLQGLVASFAAYLRDLYGAGARRFSVVSTTLVGCCPSQRAIANDSKHPKDTDKYGCFAAQNSLSGQLYPMLDATLQDLSGKLPGMNYSLADSIRMAELVLEGNSSSTGLTVLDWACCGGGRFGGGGCNISAPLCPNRSDHLFWDDYHPTEAVARMAARMIFADHGFLVHPINVQQLVGGGAAAATLD